jgi:biopolymer transport protein ExbD
MEVEMLSFYGILQAMNLSGKLYLMAELTATPQNGRRTAPPRIDLNPMVDLAFLLLTFFIFNTTLSKPTAMTTLLPADSKDSTFVARSGAVSLIVGETEILFYTGNEMASAEKIAYTEPAMLRTRLLNIQQQLMRSDGTDDKLFVMIKPTDKASFGNVVNLLDEMKICSMKRYTLADLSAEEAGLIAGL